MRRTLWLAFFLLVVAHAGQAAAEATFLAPGHPDLTKVLPPPPAPDSADQTADVAAVLAVQKTRSPAQADRALTNAMTGGTFGFANVLGPGFTAERLPKVAALFDRIRGDAAVTFTAAKSVWNRARPYAVSPAVEPVGEKPADSSYPSGASTAGYLTAIILADMVPEKSAALYARGRELGDDRVVLGVHFPTDVEAGRLAATALAAALLENPAFVAEFAAAKAELRQALGL